MTVFDRVVVAGLFGAAVGRLLAKDTLLREPRNALLVRVGGLVPVSGTRFVSHDVAAIVRSDGVAPLTPDAPVVALAAAWRAKIVEGMVCPSCVSWHVLFWATLALRPRALLSREGWFELFAAWGVAGIVHRTTG